MRGQSADPTPSIDPNSPIRHTPLGDQVYHLLWQRIVSHQLRPGDKLSDLHLSRTLGVSRTPIREALRRLVQDGIVRAENRRGFFVATFSSQDVREIYDLRTALEVLAVRLALPHLQDDALDAAQRALDEASQRIASGDERGHEQFLTIDRQFHQLIVDSAQNRRLSAMLASLQAQLSIFQIYGVHFRELLDQSIRHHQTILRACKDRDRVAAEQAMEAHIQDVKAFVLIEFADQAGNDAV